MDIKRLSGFFLFLLILLISFTYQTQVSGFVGDGDTGGDCCDGDPNNDPGNGTGDYGFPSDPGDGGYGDSYSDNGAGYGDSYGDDGVGYGDSGDGGGGGEPNLPSPVVSANAQCSGTSSYTNIWWGLPGNSDNIWITRSDNLVDGSVGNIPSWTPIQDASAAGGTTYGYTVYYHDPTNGSDQSGRGLGVGWSHGGYVAVNTASCAPPAVYADAQCNGGSSYTNVWWNLPASSDNIWITRTDNGVDGSPGNIPSWTPWTDWTARINNTPYAYQVYYHSPVNGPDVSGRGLGPGWSKPGYVGVTTGTCAPYFAQYAPTAICSAPNDPGVNVSWQPSTGATDYAVYYNRPGIGWSGGWFTGGATSLYISNAMANFNPGENIQFIIYATDGVNAWASDNGNWGNFVTYPDCAPPGVFNFSANPQPICTAPNAPGQIYLNWTQSAGATNYLVSYRDAVNTVNYWNTPGLAATLTGTPPFTPGTSYGFLITASKPAPNPYIAYSNGNWTDALGIYTTFPDCNQFIINLTLSTTKNGVTQTVTPRDPPLPIKQNENATLAWSITNPPAEALTCTATRATSPVPPQDLSAFWSGTKTTPGSLAFPPPDLIGVGYYGFTLTCTNTATGVTGSNTITLKVDQLEKPFIQTTGGDVHTNESISIPRN